MEAAISQYLNSEMDLEPHILEALTSGLVGVIAPFLQKPEPAEPKPKVSKAKPKKQEEETEEAEEAPKPKGKGKSKGTGKANSYATFTGQVSKGLALLAEGQDLSDYQKMVTVSFGSLTETAQEFLEEHSELKQFEGREMTSAEFLKAVYDTVSQGGAVKFNNMKVASLVYWAVSKAEII